MYAVPDGCKRVDCKGVSYSRTRCRSPECLELILWYWQRHASNYTKQKPTFNVGYHAIGRDLRAGMPQAWKSKQDVGPVYSNITDPDRHFSILYGKHVTTHFVGKPGYKMIKNCFCCNPSKMTLRKKAK